MYREAIKFGRIKCHYYSKLFVFQPKARSLKSLGGSAWGLHIRVGMTKKTENSLLLFYFMLFCNYKLAFISWLKIKIGRANQNPINYKKSSSNLV